jgi:Holliday junction resolvase-like predicted endonuclease
LGQNTSKWLAGDDIPWCKVRKETPENLLAVAGVSLRAAQELHQFASASKGFRAWLAESDLQQISVPISEWESAATGAKAESGLYQGPETLARGNFGERAATEALAADGHTILSYKPDIMGTNQGGIDMVTIRNGVVHFIDNKALTRSGNVSSVTALTTNFANNRAATVQEFTQFANDLRRSPAERAMFQRAVNDINQGKYVRAVTNANLTRDTAILSGVSGKLKALGLVFIDVMR